MTACRATQPPAACAPTGPRAGCGRGELRWARTATRWAGSVPAPPCPLHSCSKTCASRRHPTLPTLPTTSRPRPAPRQNHAVLGLGSPGGSAIIGTVFNVLVRILNDGTPLEAATRAPRVVSRNYNPAFMEQALYNNTDLLRHVEDLGFNVSSEFGPRPLGFVQSVEVDPSGNGVTGVADPRLPAGSAAGC